MAPTNEQIRRVLAEFMGWTDFWEGDQSGRHWLMGMAPKHQGFYAWEDDRTEVPDYTNDLNVMHEVEEQINQHALLAEYQRELYRRVEGRAVPDGVYVYFPAWFEVWHMTHATAEQRARAAYSVIVGLGLNAKENKGG